MKTNIRFRVVCFLFGLLHFQLSAKIISPDSLPIRKFNLPVYFFSGPDSNYSDSLYSKRYHEVYHFNVDSLFMCYAAKGYDSVFNELNYYYDDIITHMPYGHAMLEVERMKQAAQKLKSSKLAYEAEYMGAMIMTPFACDSLFDVRTELLNDVAQKAAKRGDLSMMMRAMHNHFLGSYQSGRYAEAFKSGILIASKLERISDKQYEGKRELYYHLGEAYYVFCDYDRAIPFLKMALVDTTRHYFDRSNMKARLMLGEYYRKTDQLDFSDYYYQSILDSKDVVRLRPLYDAAATINLGYNQVKRKEFDHAIDLLKSGIPFIIHEKDYYLALKTAIGMGECYLGKKDMQNSKRMIDSIHVFMTKISNNSRQEVYRYLYPFFTKYYAEIHDPELFQNYFDSTLLVNKRYEEYYNTLHILRAEQEYYDNEKRAKNEQIKSHEDQLVFSVIIIIWAITALGIITYLYRKKKAAYRTLIEQNQKWAQTDMLETVNSPDKEEISAISLALKPDKEDKELINRVHNLLVNEKVYKDAELSLDSLALLLNVSRNSLSRAINRTTGKNFNKYVNEYRIKEALRIMSAEKHRMISIDDLMEQVGFNSRSTFYQSFKNTTGLSPAEFRNNKNE